MGDRSAPARLLSALLAAATLAGGSSVAAQETDPCHDPADAAYESHDCKVVRLRAQPWVVIATVDSGINPYHEDFRLPMDHDMQGVHPSEFIEGYPADIEPLDLTFDASSYSQAVSADQAAWSSVGAGEPRWIPGTNIIAGYGEGGSFRDTSGHGTGVASVAGGLRYGESGDNVLLVGVDGAAGGWRWAAEQPWIDLISISWSLLIPVLDTSAEASRAAAAAGQMSCVATGNLTVPIWYWEAQGPSWNVDVGAVDDDGQPRNYSGSPADVMGHTDFEAAAHNSLDATRSFGGTSAATPYVCSMLARAITEVRTRFGDTTEGPHGGGLAVGEPAAGPLADGVLTNYELVDAVEATATPVEGDASWVRSGYGIVDAGSIDAAVDVLFGDDPRPERTEEDLWQQAGDTARNVVYGDPP